MEKPFHDTPYDLYIPHSTILYRLDRISLYDLNIQHWSHLLTMLYDNQVSIPGRRTRSFPRSGKRIKPSHSLSYPRVPSAHQRPMVSVKSEGSTTLRRKLDMQEESNLSRLEKSHLNGSQARRDDSSDDSGGEDEHIVRIDSPSRLSFRQASWSLLTITIIVIVSKLVC